MQQPRTLSSIGLEILTLIQKVDQLAEKQDGLEAYLNQQSMLVNTIGDIMEELKKQEH